MLSESEGVVLIISQYWLVHFSLKKLTTHCLLIGCYGNTCPPIIIIIIIIILSHEVPLVVISLYRAVR